MHKRKILIVSLIAVLALTLTTVSGCAIGLKNPWDRPATTQINLPSDFKILEETWEVLSRDYVNHDAVDARKLSQAAVKGMISALNDPYTAYLDGDDSGTERSMITGSYGGIGAVVGVMQDQIVIIEVFPDSPASLAGIKAGDSIAEINGESTSGFTVNDAVSLIKGEKGTVVSLKVVHHGDPAPQELEVVRGDIKMSTVTSKMLSDGIAYIRVAHFSEGTAAELESALREAQGQGSKAIVLDLRGNPGGLLESAIDVASQFLKDGAVVWEGLGGDQWREWKVRQGGLATDTPMAVLVNADSASGSEVVAGALQDHGRAILIGEKTFGKGSVNLMRELSDGSSIYVTHARWLTPDRKLIEGEGITPDRVVAQTPEQRLQGIDPQLDAAIDYLKTATAAALPTPA